MRAMRRRELLVSGAATAGSFAFGPALLQKAFAAPATVGESPYGPLGPPDVNGISLPAGFSSRLIARQGQNVPGTSYEWHMLSDAQATYALKDGGWILVTNAETLSVLGGGASAIRFSASGDIVDAYRICGNTSINCAGGPTPWGTWLTCEEFEGGQVWECDPLGRAGAVVRPAMGVFNHEAAVVDPVHRHVYMTEDEGNGCIYRFVPDSYPNLGAGKLQALIADGPGPGSWGDVADPSGIDVRTRDQVAGAYRFNGGEGMWYDDGYVYFTTKGDHRLWAWDTNANQLEILYDGLDPTSGGFLTGPDNCSVSRSGDVFVCEDNGETEFDIVMMTPERVVSPFLRCSGPIHYPGELAGVVFSPDGNRMYFTSQRAYGPLAGAVFEIVGPFRAARPGWQPPAPLEEDETPPFQDGDPGGDVDPPGLVIRARKWVSLASLRKEGLSVEVAMGEPGTVKAALTTNDLEFVRRDGSQVKRPKAVRLDTARATFPDAGRRKVKLKPSQGRARQVDSTLSRLRRRGRKGKPAVRARVEVQATDNAGNVRVANRRVSIGSPTKPRAKNRR